MNKIVLGLVGATALVASAMTFANTTDTTAHSWATGLYAGTDLGYAVSPQGLHHLSKDQTSTLKNAKISQDKDGFAFDFHLGYVINKYVAAEAGYLRLPRVGYNDKGLKVLGLNKTFTGLENNNAVYTDVKGMFPINAQFNVFAKAGLAVVFSNLDHDATINGEKVSIDSATDTNYMPLVGAGVEYKVLPQLGVNAQYTALINASAKDKPHSTKRGFPTTHIATVGVNYYF